MLRMQSCVLMLAAAITGCRTCDNPYDYCGPVVDAGFHPAGFRAGSAMAAEATTFETIPAPPPRPTPPASEPPTPAPADSAPLDEFEMPRTDTGFVRPMLDAPPTMGDSGTISVMRPRSRLRYAR
jgi:hypothetical protein